MSDSESSDEEPLAFIQNKASLPKGFTIPKGPSSKPPPTNINKQIGSASPMAVQYPSKSEDSRKRPFSKSQDFVPSAWASAYDKQLPQELLSKCGDNKCHICNATLANPEIARSHYDAKTHEKKVQLFLENLFKDSGETPPKRVRSWETGPTYNRGSAEVANLVSKPAANTNSLGGFRNKSLQQRWVDLWDGPLPSSLVDLHGASRCGVCEVDISSLNVATAHYEGKPHAKKVREFCSKAGADIPRRKNENQEMTDKFCELCKVEFTSPTMAKSHYNGKEHVRREATGKEKIKVVEDKTGRFGIGGNFKTNTGYKPEGVDDVVEEALKNASEEELTWGAMAEVAELHPKFYCNVCNISLSSQTVYDSHIQGKNHKKKLNQPNESITNTPVLKEGAVGSSNFRCDICDISVTSEEVLNTHLQGKNHRKKLSQSIGFYGSTAVKKEVVGGSVNLRCDLCDITVTSQEILNTHMQGKNHKKKLSQGIGSNGNAVKSFHCDVCNVNTTDQNNLDMHLQGTKHNKMLRKMGLPFGALHEMDASNKLKNN